jgi:putative endonuclease
VLETNFRTRFGEIDIVANDKDCLVFVEVKARRQGALVTAHEALTPSKQARIETAAKIYAQKHVPYADYRFDVVCIEEASTYNRYQLIKNAFYLGEKR